MKKLLLFATLLVLCLAGSSQTRDCFNFQGYAIDNNGKALNNETIVIRATISGESKTNSNFSQKYVETHSSIKTDAYGVFTANIGYGTKDESASTVSFSGLYFGSIDFKLTIEVKISGESDGSYNAIYDGTLLTVPYARSAENGVPVGTIISFAGPQANIPVGYLLCDGSEYSKNEYPALYNTIANYWGGSESAPELPDLRGMFLRGVNYTRSDAYADPDDDSRTVNGKNSSNDVGSIQGDAIISHSHTGNTDTDGTHKHTNQESGKADNDDNDGVGYYIGGRGDSFNNDEGGGGFVTSDGSSHSHHFTTDENGGNETRPNNAYVVYIIRAY